MKKILLGIGFLIIMSISCNAQKNNKTYTPISQELFLEKPFGFEENIANFYNKSKTKFKTQKSLRKNKHYPEKTDTIYKFYYRKSEIFYYKTHLGKEFLLAGKIMNKKIILTNGIHVGIRKNDFTARFSDKLLYQNDSLEMIGEGTKYTFIFKKDKLARINIDNYFD